jgi:hypothetical protein
MRDEAAMLRLLFLAQSGVDETVSAFVPGFTPKSGTSGFAIGAGCGNGSPCFNAKRRPKERLSTG